jgi:hypothetical protein
MTRWVAFLWTTLATAICSTVVTIEVGKDPSMTVVEAVAGVIFLLAVSWAIAGMVFLVSGFRARRLTLVIISVATSIIISMLAIVQLAT